MTAFSENSKAGGTDEQREQIQKHLNMDQKPDADEIVDKLFEWLDTLEPKAMGVEDEAALDQMLAELDAADPSEEVFDWQKSMDKVLRDYEAFLSFVKVNDLKSAAPAKHPRKRHPKILPLVAVLLLALGLMVTVQSNIAGKSGRWTDEIFHYHDEAAVPRAVITKHPLNEGEEAVYTSLQAAMEAFGIEAPVVPAWVPERFGEPEVSAENIRMGIRIRAIYEQENLFLRISYNESEGIDYSMIEKDYTDADIVSIGEIDHYIVEDVTAAKAIWWNGELECLIYGEVTKQELTDIIMSLYEGAL